MLSQHLSVWVCVRGGGVCRQKPQSMAPSQDHTAASAQVSVLFCNLPRFSLS